MIQHKTARDLLYSWHGGQSSPFYAAASSGLCASFDAIKREARGVDDEKDRTRLLEWIERREKVAPAVIVQGRAYRVLPWVSRSYFPKD
jgi:hypothetical protein